MRGGTHPKLLDLPAIAAAAERHRRAGRSLVLCHGCFDVVHPGHLRYLQFARRQGDVLVVSITGDDAVEKSDGTRPYVPQELRAENLAALELVDHVVIAEHPTAEPVIDALRPEVYVKGREYEHSSDPRLLAERQLVERHGGRVIYSSGEVIFSSSTMIDSIEGAASAEHAIDQTDRLAICCRRWGIDAGSLRRLLSDGCAGLRVAVVGDAMLDHYVFCDASDVANEAPILSVRPMEERTYLGGAAIIAAHLRSLGAQPHLLTTVGRDQASREVLERLDRLGATHTAVQTRQQLPTKTRYLVETQKLLKVDRALAQPLDSAAEREFLGALRELRADLDAVIFADFGCGTITLPLLAAAMPMLRPHVRTIAGDVSGPRRSLLALEGADLLTPTERELRGAMGDFERSLPAVASHVMRRLGLGHLAVTMGRRGCVLFRPREEDTEDRFKSRLRCDYLPTLAAFAVDPTGAGDAFLAASTLALCAGATLPQAGYLGSAAAAIAIGRLGNLPVATGEILRWLRDRRECAPEPPAPRQHVIESPVLRSGAPVA